VDLTDGNQLLTISPGVLLSASVTYTVQLNGIRDIAGNALPNSNRTFSTAVGVDNAGNSSAAVFSPAQDATNVPVSGPFTIQFPEPVDQTEFYILNSTITTPVALEVVATGVDLPVTFSFSADGRTVTVTPVHALSPNTAYRLRTVSYQYPYDWAGNALTASATAQFTTAP
jgi:hypothetical protein